MFRPRSVIKDSNDSKDSPNPGHNRGTSVPLAMAFRSQSPNKSLRNQTIGEPKEYETRLDVTKRRTRDIKKIMENIPPAYRERFERQRGDTSDLAEIAEAFDRRKDQFTRTRSVNVFCGTWNVNGKVLLPHFN